MNRRAAAEEPVLQLSQWAHDLKPWPQPPRSSNSRIITSSSYVAAWMRAASSSMAWPSAAVSAWRRSPEVLSETVVCSDSSCGIWHDSPCFQLFEGARDGRTRPIRRCLSRSRRTRGMGVLRRSQACFCPGRGHLGDRPAKTVKKKMLRLKVKIRSDRRQSPEGIGSLLAAARTRTGCYQRSPEPSVDVALKQQPAGVVCAIVST